MTLRISSNQWFYDWWHFTTTDPYIEERWWPSPAAPKQNTVLQPKFVLMPRNNTASHLPLLSACSERSRSHQTSSIRFPPLPNAGASRLLHHRLPKMQLKSSPCTWGHKKAHGYFILKQVICKKKSSVTEGEMPGAKHKTATGFLTPIKFCSSITFRIEYLCSNTAWVATSVCSFFSVLLYSCQIIPPMLKVKPPKKQTSFPTKKSQHF